MEFKAKNGEVFEFRPLEEGDAEQCMEFINGLIEEGTFIRMDKKATLDEEKKYVKDKVEKTKEGKMVLLVAVKDGKVVGNCEITKIGGHQDHVGIFAVGVNKDFRRIGIGEGLAREIISKAPGIGIELVTLHAVQVNAPAVALYAKLGFVPGAVIQKEFKFNGEYYNSILMRLDLAKNRQKAVP